MRGLCWFDTGARKIYNSKRPIATPADLKGMKIRVEENPVRVASFNAMGAQATAMSFNQVYGALQQGVVEGAENSELTYMTNRHNEVAPYLSNTDHFITPNCIVVSTAFYTSLPKELQDLLVQVGKDTGTFERKIWAEAGAKLTAEMKAAGVKVNDADQKAFKAMVASCRKNTHRRSRRNGGRRSCRPRLNEGDTDPLVVFRRREGVGVHGRTGGCWLASGTRGWPQSSPRHT